MPAGKTEFRKIGYFILFEMIFRQVIHGVFIKFGNASFRLKLFTVQRIARDVPRRKTDCGLKVLFPVLKRFAAYAEYKIDAYIFKTFFIRILDTASCARAVMDPAELF